ncbi:hypothetical protein TRFO_28674 [Tritrichomonas foetus]|uniref:HMG box domain-containing protein n=1 Tax=Tritrichomonas foetus TaxID=1144522 RepID=A0A1J4JZN3_9EUKA|nr:hypothetical protein TRFO_28674 [Tritrichomonas foetus]|eukprot:OHT03952.1 hypothetical protein TRFO_28674 [Tritrichomonas foetus]
MYSINFSIIQNSMTTFNIVLIFYSFFSCLHMYSSPPLLQSDASGLSSFFSSLPTKSLHVNHAAPSKPNRDHIEPFQIFCLEKRAKVAKMHPNLSSSRITSLLGTLWRATPQQEKQIYANMASSVGRGNAPNKNQQQTNSHLDGQSHGQSLIQSPQMQSLMVQPNINSNVNQPNMNSNIHSHQQKLMNSPLNSHANGKHRLEIPSITSITGPSMFNPLFVPQIKNNLSIDPKSGTVLTMTPIKKGNEIKVESPVEGPVSKSNNDHMDLCVSDQISSQNIIEMPNSRTTMMPPLNLFIVPRSKFSVEAAEVSRKIAV